jgi:hypothetical protein
VPARPASAAAAPTAPSPARPRLSALDELMTWPPDAQLPCPACGGTTEGLLDRGSIDAHGGTIIRTEALPCGCDVSDQAQPLQAAAVAAGYLQP